MVQQPIGVLEPFAEPAPVRLGQNTTREVLP
jgi:hypothetical protein